MTTMSLNSNFAPRTFKDSAEAAKGETWTARRALSAETATGTTTDHLHPGVPAIMVGCFGIMMIAFWLTFRASTEAMFAVVVSGFYLAMYVGTPWVMRRVREANSDVEDTMEQKDPGTFGEFLAGRMETATGSLTGWEVVAQACSIPIGVMLATIGICFVIALN
jgi:hypothetical protein